MLLLSVALFLLIVTVPAIPTIREVIRPRDDGRLPIAEQYVRDPRWFGHSLRTMLAPFVLAARRDPAYRDEVKLRTDEEVSWVPDFAVAPKKRLRGIAVGERVRVGEGAAIRDAYAIESLEVGPNVVARTLTSDGILRIGDGVEVLRWVDADGEITVGANANLGVSASGGARLTMGNGVRFERVWAKPVASRTAGSEAFPFVSPLDPVCIGQAEVDAGTSLIIYGPVRILCNTRVPSHVKVHGSLEVETGVRIGGNVIVRGDVTLSADVGVSGHIFAEGDIRLGPHSRIGRTGGVKTVFAAGHVLIADDVEVEGWVISESGGQTI